ISQPGMSDDIALPSSEPMLICIGHSPVKPLAASPLMGSTAQSSRRSNVRRNFMAGIIAEVVQSRSGRVSHCLDVTKSFLDGVGYQTAPPARQTPLRRCQRKDESITD